MIELSLRNKLTGAFLLIAIVAVALVGLFIQQANITELRNAAVTRERNALAVGLADLYRSERSWANVRSFVDQRLGVRSPAPQTDRAPGEAPPSKGGPSGPPRTASLPALADADDVVLLPVSDLPRGTAVPAEILASFGTPIMVDGQKVGTVLLFPARDTVGPEDAIYLERTNRALWLGSFGGVVVALMIGLFLAQRFTAPIRHLTAAADRMAAGDLDQRVRVESKDEIGRLAVAFNQMSQNITLQVQLRRQMTADIAHDLRTPLTSIAGYVEAMHDGDLEPTQERLALVYTEVKHLQQLVTDLRLLSQADAGELRLNLQALAPTALIERAAAAHRHAAEQRGVDLQVEARASVGQVQVDEARMARVFDNLVDNAVQHTPAGGRVVLSAHADAAGIVFSVRDTGLGIPAEDLPHVFDRFYRADKARGADGHSGLGLAIVRALVEAHGGTIKADSQPGKGTEFIATLPAAASA